MSVWYQHVEGDVYKTRRALRWVRPDVQVPEEFHFNVSVPNWLRWLVDPHDERLFKAAAFHDYTLMNLEWSRPLAGALFNEILREHSGLPRWWRLVLFTVVSLWKAK